MQTFDIKIYIYDKLKLQTVYVYDGKFSMQR
jgi:hypothetical protein